MRFSAFFSPGLDPVLDGGERYEDAMVSPKAPTGHAIRQTVLHDQSHGQVDHAVRVVTARRSQCRHVYVEVLPAVGAIVNRIGELNVVWPTREKVAQIMKRSMRGPISITTASTACAGTTTMTATTLNDLRLWKIFGGCSAFGGIWNIPTWSRHGGALRDNAPLLGSGREIYPKPRVVSSPKPDFAATVSISLPFSQPSDSLAPGRCYPRATHFVKIGQIRGSTINRSIGVSP